ncbi:MAG: hypothetical protein RI894_2290 [Bacteroidota bacterium]
MQKIYFSSTIFSSTIFSSTLLLFFSSFSSLYCSNLPPLKPIIAHDAPLGDPKIPTIAPKQAKDYMGKKVAVEGLIVNTFYADFADGQPTFLNLDQPFPKNPMSIVIFETDVKKMSFNSLAYQNKRVVITGIVESYTDEYKITRPQIKITDISQIAIKN